MYKSPASVAGRHSPFEKCNSWLIASTNAQPCVGEKTGDSCNTGIRVELMGSSQSFLGSDSDESPKRKSVVTPYSLDIRIKASMDGAFLSLSQLLRAGWVTPSSLAAAVRVIFIIFRASLYCRDIAFSLCLSDPHIIIVRTTILVR